MKNTNPTQMVMKSDSEEQREANAPGPEYRKGRNPQVKEAHEVADDEGLEREVHNPAHPAMQTRHSLAKNMKHADGRKHEDDHHAVRKLKGMM